MNSRCLRANALSRLQQAYGVTAWLANGRIATLSRRACTTALVVLAVLSGAMGPAIEPADAGGQRAGRPALVQPDLRPLGAAAPRRSSASCRTQLHADERLIVDVSVTNRRRWLGIWAIEVQDVVGREAKRAARRRSDRRPFFSPRRRPAKPAQVAYAGPTSAARRYRFGPLRVVDAVSAGAGSRTAW